MEDPKIEKINFKEVDQVGIDTLDVISDAGRFNRWMYETIQPHCKGNILEIGSGVGNISQFFLDDNASITLSDVRENYCERLQQKFGSYQNLKGITLLDLVNADFENQYQQYIGSFDTVFALNVVEHIYDDNLAIQNARKLLKDHGQLVILVPSYQTLFNKLDEALDHYRRYNKKSLSSLMTKHEFDIMHQQYFNFMGIFAWFISGKLQKNDSIPRGQMRLYNALVPIFKMIDWMVLRTGGLSTIVVGKKKS